MSDRVIEPSEIITGREEPKTSNPAHVNPWVRLIARFFDYMLFFAILQIAVGPLIASLSFEHFLPVEFFAWIPIETLLLWQFGATPGKWLLGTELKRGHKRGLPFEVALRRSFSVWLRGIGMGIAFFNFICMITAYYKLKLFKISTWDRDEKIYVNHRPIPRWRLNVVGGFVILGLIFYSHWKKSWI